MVWLNIEVHGYTGTEASVSPSAETDVFSREAPNP